MTICGDSQNVGGKEDKQSPSDSNEQITICGGLENNGKINIDTGIQNAIVAQSRRRRGEDSPLADLVDLPAVVSYYLRPEKVIFFFS